MTRTPVYFLSHGGPNIMEDYDHPAYKKLQEIGREITQKVKPKAVVVFSAHWQASPTSIQVNTAELTDLIYDYYGFPDHYYKVKYPNVGSKELSSRVLSALKAANIPATGVSRGLDHGVFAPFTVAFDPKTNPLNVPLVQVSLFDSDDADQHYRLGEAMQGLREQGVAVIVSGMAVHNLRDMWQAMQRPAPMPYSVSFDAALKEAVEQKPEDRQKAMAELLRRSDARKAHPSFEHLLPVHIGAGAAGDDAGKQLWTLPQGSMSWAQFRFGEISNLTA
ncbi:aromatic ring-opening dioxygenase LigB subunit [Aureobasidium subglaciale]|nr:aromatic ring-opening dioxygenase LigB subunit [Aureobasidium subglaciale]KAI5221801.1 aromatic ring-opening dioxygenase LigB subunit [Aureobasidium subglaciale]KAI5225820.1 aromatic ring-opening dioxygenase LigB subunit [Aureobasidium subglaciale]KAI5261550.1 aromatic ring-opening dioxygenase LigB subunit [Aureobasidium subglaciale]